MAWWIRLDLIMLSSYIVRVLILLSLDLCGRRFVCFGMCDFRILFDFLLSWLMSNLVCCSSYTWFTCSWGSSIENESNKRAWRVNNSVYISVDFEQICEWLHVMQISINPSLLAKLSNITSDFKRILVVLDCINFTCLKHMEFLVNTESWTSLITYDWN